ncbi:hypothetical protein LMG9449_0080 [Lactococcus lactis subsp. lactis]|uniref:7-keto-8-aminopelargonate synthetase and related enzymes n=1 Tax=Lactococcus lactis subsp. lactis TaxID=1360 RepID=A0A0B8QL33_LACLL|nr:hypothetical protein ATCC19435_1663 [Lactococcus lactis subsp. lactis]CDI45631.1 hypothetical protein BN927_01641 [Lactococcus lactis subsp. lactis Dephy 1]KSU01654.1 hypothetical protein LKF24_0202 [Lactococcus lactis subsp. lactis]KSU14169.1 hypothetical protein LMG9446_1332 [Lactococcus lactis subsp. lactis]KSU22810.1 hypothetical protein LMG9449_0080 [Lactococcus lactis subsp. lactis]
MIWTKMPLNKKRKEVVHLLTAFFDEKLLSKVRKSFIINFK